jgi:hypothetical protein
MLAFSYKIMLVIGKGVVIISIVRGLEEAHSDVKLVVEVV